MSGLAGFPVHHHRLLGFSQPVEEPSQQFVCPGVIGGQFAGPLEVLERPVQLSPMVPGFAKVKRDLLTRGIFTSVTDLARKLRRFITKYNERAKPVRWAYVDPSRRIA